MSEKRIVTRPSGAAYEAMSGRSLETASIMKSIDVVASSPVSPCASSRAVERLLGEPSHAELLRGVEGLAEQRQGALAVAAAVAVEQQAGELELDLGGGRPIAHPLDRSSAPR